MIHLDRNHHTSPLSPNEKQNLILPTDHHKILSWSSLDDTPFPSATHPPDSRNGPITPNDPNDPPTTGPSSPASPADGNSASPTGDRSSSLTPPPDTGTPQTRTDSPPAPPATEKEAPQLSALPEEEEEEETRVDKASRQSTPLSELSPPPDQDDEDGAAAPNVTKEEPNSGKGGVSEEGARQKKERNADVAESRNGSMHNTTTSPPGLSAYAPNAHPSPASDFRANHDSNPVRASSLSMASTPTSRPHSLSNRTSSTIDSFNQTPSTSNPVPDSPTHVNDAKVVSILELNMELLKVCMEFQSRGPITSEPRFQQYATRLQSNLTWLAAAADHSRQGNHSNMLLPTMDAPAPVDTPSNDRIQQLYAELPSIFAKEIARRQQMGVVATAPPPAPANVGINPPSLKRDRSDDPSTDFMSKRRDTGDGKAPNPMAPPSLPATSPVTHPVSNHFSLPIHNGNTPTLPQHSPPPDLGMNSSMVGPPSLNTAEAQLAASSRERQRQEQIRAAQQQAARQVSPSAGSGQGVGHRQQQQMHGMPNMTNATAGPSNAPGMANVNPAMNAMNPSIQQTFQILQTPNHPFVQYMIRTVPNFQALPMQAQIQKMLMAHSAMQARQQEQLQQNQQNQQTPQHRGGASMPNLQQMPGMPSSMQNSSGMPGGQFPPQTTSPVSPVSHQSMAQNPQNLFSLGNQGHSNNNGMDPRSMASAQGGVPGMDMGSIRQRQLIMMQQTRSGGGGNANGNPAMMMNQMNPQQAFVHQERMRQEQRLNAQQTGSPTHSNSPMPGNDGFPIRSNSTIPGIARSTRSPSDGAPSPRVPTRGTSMGQDDYQRMMMQQQQQQQQQQQNMAPRGMPSQSPGFNQQMSSNWQQNPHQQQQPGMQLSHGQGSNYGMSPPGSAGHNQSYGTAPSPTNSQHWAQGSYPFSPSPGSTSHPSDHTQGLRHMSGTPVPQQQQQLMQPQNASPTDHSIPNDFDLFNWAT